MPFDMLAALLSSSPDEQALVDLDDSITKSDLNEEEDQDDDIGITDKQPLTLLQIPKALKIECFNYLCEDDLFNAEKTCRCLNSAARDPNSLYYLSARDQFN